MSAALDELRGAISHAVQECGDDAERRHLVSDLADFLRTITADAVDFELVDFELVDFELEDE